MRNFISRYLLVLLLSLLLWGAVAETCRNIKYCDAREYHGKILQRIEDSYFDGTVIRECITEAEKRGYRLSVDCYGGDRKRARITLRYEYGTPLMRTKKQYVVDGYAR